MKKIFILSAIVALCASMFTFSSCQKEIVDTDQYAGGPIVFAAMAPNPIARGAELRIIGKNLENVKEVHIQGVDPITDIQVVKKGTQSEIRVIVPAVGPEVGKVVLVDKDGNKTQSKFDLEFDESALVFDGFKAADVVMPGDVIEILGDYINTVKEVVFSGGEDGNGAYAVGESIFDQTRTSAKVIVPADAITGIIKIGTVNEVSDKNTIPTIFPSEDEVVVGEPVVYALSSEYGVEDVEIKAGNALKINGEYLNMIKAVKFVGADANDFIVDSDATAMLVTVPANAQEGEVTLISYANVEYIPEGTVIPVIPGNLKVAADNKEDRYKAGLGVIVTGEDLSIVSAISFGGVDVYDLAFTAGQAEEGKTPIDSIRCTIPFNAPDGDLVVKMNNGDQVAVSALEYVKPTYTDKGPETIVARESYDIKGADLELIKSLTIGGIECKIAIDSLGVRGGFDEENQPIEIPVYDSTLLHVFTAPDILSGDVVISLENGYTETIAQMDVTYNEAISFTYESPSIQLGQPLTLIGEHLFLVESVSIKGKKVTSYVCREDKKLSFNMPDGMGPGVYRLDITLIDGQTLTWAIPFEMTAPYTETVMWEGEVDLGNWSLNWEMKPADMFVAADAKEGDIFRIYGYTTADAWQVQTFDGHWGGLDMGLGNGNNVNNEIYDLSNGYIAIELDATRAEAYTTLTDWGYCGILQGESFVVTRLTLIKWGAAEKATAIWEGPWTCAGWGGNQDLAWGGYDWSTVNPGTILRVTCTPTVAAGEWWCVSLRHADGWGNLPAPVPGQYDSPEGGIVELELTADILADLVACNGLVVTGDGFIMEKIELVEAGAAPMPTVLWEGEAIADDWTDQPNLLSDGGVELIEAGASEGQQVLFYITPLADDWKLQIVEGHWGPTYASFCSVGNDTEDGKFTEWDLDAKGGYVSITLTQEMLDAAAAVQYWGGTFIGNGDNVKITKISLL